MGRLHCPSRPLDVDDLIRRIKDPGRDKNESNALQALLHEMIQIFRLEQQTTYLSEAALLAGIAEGEQYELLMSAFSNAIILNTPDNNVLDPPLLRAFALALRHKGVLSAENHHLGATLDSLSKRLGMASNVSEPQKQYQLVCMLGVVLDAMVDVEVTGLHRESLHKPLLDQLQKLRSSPEPRMAQAASYAYEALKGVPDNEGPWEAFGRHAGDFIWVLANMAGAASKLDPASLIDTAPGVMKLLGAIKTVAENVKQLYEESENLKTVFVDAVNGVAKPRQWFVALRYSRLLLEAGAFELLKQLLPELPGNKGSFWCGLYSQLEQSWVGNSTSRSTIEDFIDWMHAQEFFKKESGECLEISHWRNLVMGTMRRPEWEVTPPKAYRSHRYEIWKKKEVKPKLSLFSYQSNDLPGVKGELFSKAWEKSRHAHKYYADARLIRYYTQGDRLQITRISGDSLDLKDCYVNLSTVESSTEPDNGGKGFEISLGARLKVETPEPGKEVNLPDLFKERAGPNGSKERPRKILIRGRAGVGKTTLCKKIVYDFCHGRLWHGQYDRILWIPLRKLRASSGLQSFVKNEFFADCADEKHLAKALWEHVFDDSKRTIFLLDGFDEVVGERSTGVKLVEKFQDLFHQANTIITSRPDAAMSYFAGYDLELETIGFSPHQVQVYVNRVVKNETHKAEIRKFVKAHSTLSEVLQIPIQLDALCFAWAEIDTDVKTMSALYKAIEIKLWRKDMTRLKDIDDSQASKDRLRSQIETKMGEEMRLLEMLAFNGLYHNAVEFHPQHGDALYQEFPHWSDSMLNGLSFLRTPNSHIHYFIHLTFQEYFAAAYFVRCWVGDEPLSIFPFDGMTREDISPRKFIEEEKYNGRYNVMWRFVSGLLPAPKLAGFLGAVDSEPRDLFGPTHLRILLHCFNEVSLEQRGWTSNSELRDLYCKLEISCRQLLSDSKGYRRVTYQSFLSSLVEEMEFPEHILEQSLKDKPSQLRHIMNILARRRELSPSILKTVMNDVEDDGRPDVRQLICAIMARNSASAQDDVWRILRDPSSERHDDLIRNLARLNALSEEMILALLSHEHEYSKEFWDRIWDKHRRALSKQALHSLLGDERVQVRDSFCPALKHYMPLSDESWDLVLALLKDESSCVRQGITDALGHQYDLPQHVVKALTSVLQTDQDRNTRKNVALSLLAQNFVSSDTISIVKASITRDCLYDKETIDAFCENSCLTAEMRTKLESMLENLNSAVAQDAAELLSKHSSYAVDLLGALQSLPEDARLEIPRRAVFCFQQFTKLPERILQGLMVLSHKNDELARQAQRCISNQENLPESVSRALIAELHSEDPKAREIGAKILRWLPNAPNGLSDALMHILRDKSTPIRAKANAISVVSHRAAWQDRILIDVFKKHPKLSSEILEELFVDCGRFSDEQFQIVRVQSDLPVPLLESIIDGLGASFSPVERSSIWWWKILLNREDFFSMIPELSAARLEKVVQRLLSEARARPGIFCYFRNETLVIGMPEQSYELPMKSLENKERFLDTLAKARG